MNGFQKIVCAGAMCGLVACGGSPGGGGEGTAAPDPGTPASHTLTGHWIDPNNGTVLMVTPDGLGYGVLHTGADATLVRGTLTLTGTTLPLQPLDAVNASGESNQRQLTVQGGLQPSGALAFDVSDPKGVGGPVTLVVDTAYEPPLPLAQWAGSYVGAAQVAGLQGECLLELDANGGLTMSNTPTVGDVACDATGRLDDVAGAPSLKSFKLCFAGTGCNLSDNPSFEGLARLAGAAPSPTGPRPLLTLVGMDLDAQNGLLIEARP